MSLSKSQVVDRVVLAPDKGRVVLVAIDDGDIPSPGAREKALDEKLRAYLEFYLTKQHQKLAPDHAHLPVEIIVVCTTAPTDGMARVKGIRDHNRPDTFLPVDVTTVQGFKLALSKPSANQLPDPTSPSVTPPAGAGDAPSVAADH